MISNYEQVSLGDHCDLFTGFAFKSAEFRTGNDGEVRLARGDNIKEGYFEWGEKEKRWTSVTPDLTRYLLRKGDILVGMDGSKVGKNWVEVSESDLPCLLVQRVCCFRAKRTLHQRLLRYFVSGKTFKSYIDAVKTGTSIPHISMGQIRNFMIPLIPMPQQKAIAHILGALDDKIELNQKMNETLEDIAKAIFKSWFVDFDPVRAKAEGRPTGLSAEISDLFPDAFEDSEIGEIPAAWRLETIGDLADCVGGATPSTKSSEFWDNGIHAWTTPKDLSNSRSIHLMQTDRKITDLGLKKISSGLLPTGTVLLSSRAPVGYLALTTEPTAINQGYIALRPKGAVSNYYLLHWCDTNLGEIKSRASGTTFAEISKASFRPIRALAPHDDVMSAFHRIVSPIYERMHISSKETLLLEELRDTLLPKLISGELRIPDAERFLAEAGI